ncbi:MAG TPA: hypothetical protein VGG10_19645 [Rhizomicrobium sp.]|jgi:hypothetical protein
MQRIDIVHLLLLLAALAGAYLLPFELILLSYAILGPAHYLTEISWLHDRNYYLPHKAIATGLVALAFGAMFIADPYWSGVLLWSAFLGCAVAATATTAQKAALWGVMAVAVTILLMGTGMPFGIAGALMPTLIHVSLFTLVFMTLGALRSGSRGQLAIVGAYLIAITLIVVVPPWAGSVVPALARVAQENFGNVAPALGSLFGIPDLKFGGRITGLLSFVYTYHYLNWFIKADVIKWTQIPRARLAGIVAASAASTALYFYNYEIGILVLVVVSMMHVLLEFPLNAISIGQLGSLALGRSSRRAAI